MLNMAAQFVGIKRARLALFASLTRLPISSKTIYDKHSKLSLAASMRVADVSLAEARAKAVAIQGGSKVLPVEIDHRWSHKRNAQEGTLVVTSYGMVFIYLFF